MKTVLLALITMLAGMNAANAQPLELNVIDTNDCSQIVSDINLMNGSVVGVNATCEGPGTFGSDSGNVYAYRVHTTINVNQQVAQGAHIRLNYIDTNDCTRFMSEIPYLNSDAISVNATCVGPGSYAASNGNVYSYRIVTLLTVN